MVSKRPPEKREIATPSVLIHSPSKPLPGIVDGPAGPPRMGGGPALWQAASATAIAAAAVTRIIPAFIIPIVLSSVRLTRPSPFLQANARQRRKRPVDNVQDARSLQSCNAG